MTTEPVSSEESSKKSELKATLLGDANCDGIVAVDDAVMLCRMVSEDKTVIISDLGMINADCDGVRGVSSDDVTMMLKLIARIISKDEMKAPA